MKVFYRISDNGYKNKIKLPNATKKRCLLNFLLEWPVEEVTVFMDHCIPETEQFLRDYQEMVGLNIVPINGGSSAGSWRIVAEEALKLPDHEVVYFVEDDYFHLTGSRRALLEGIERADYVTLYDNPDKYIPASKGGNPLISDEGGEYTQVILTKSCHWKLTNSTTMTFATTVKTLREDKDVWSKFTVGTYPHDFDAFLALREKGRTLISPIPSFSTHCETAWLAPLIDWSEI